MKKKEQGYKRIEISIKERKRYGGSLARKGFGPGATGLVLELRTLRRW